MASHAPASFLERLRTQPLPGRALAAVAGSVWIAGALYCSGYEALSTGLKNWPGSLWWSAVAVLPWLAVFEWSKSPSGRRASARSILGALLLVAALSVSFELAVNRALGSAQAEVTLTIVRRLPAIAAALLLILWSRAQGRVRQAGPQAEASLASLAPSIEWIEAADNYIELHLRGRTVMRRMTMRDAEQALVSRGFIRIHRRYLVNRNCIAAISGGTEPLIQLDGGTELPVGRSFAANLERAA